MESSKRSKTKKKEKKVLTASSAKNSKNDKKAQGISCCALISIIIGAVGYYIYTNTFYIPEFPAVDLDVWWGPNDTKHTQDTSIRPFRIVFSDAMQEQLVKKFEHYRSAQKHKSFAETAWTYGVHSSARDQVFAFWQYKYKIKKRERWFNKFEHFKTNVQGLDLHFMRVRPEVENVKVLPIILLHGWPSSFREFFEVAPLLTTQRPNYDFVFEVVVPSLPGFGFSQAAVRPGLGPFQVAIVMRNLMKRLGFTKYYIQGGDFGHTVGSIMATLFPDEVLGFHSNMPVSLGKAPVLGWVLGGIWPSLVDEQWQLMYPLKEKVEFQIEETGYSHLQATKPDTIGKSLSLIFTTGSNSFVKVF